MKKAAEKADAAKKAKKAANEKSSKAAATGMISQQNMVASLAENQV